jgi:hypothetical protein
MTDQLPSSKTLVRSLTVILIVAAVVAGYFAVKYNQANEQIASLTSQLGDAQKQIAELQPLADKALTLPISLRIDRHALTAGYDLFIINRAGESLRFHFAVGNRQLETVIDGGKWWTLQGLASGDVVQIDSKGYNSKTVTIQ